MTTEVNSEFQKLLEENSFRVPQQGETVTGIVLSASKAEVRLDIDGILTGVVRGPELYEGDEDYANLKPGDEVEATVIANENENGELELSFRYAGQEKALAVLRKAFEEHTNIKVKVIAANKGGLLAVFGQIQGFLPVSQLSPENYPRVSGGDKTKILEKLKSFVDQIFEVKVTALDEKEDKIIFNEKDAWTEKQKDVISQYKIGSVVEGNVTAVTDFGVFISFGENLEGLIHISELAWQRIDDPSDLFHVGDKVKAEIINIDGAKIFLSAKKLIQDPWSIVDEKFKLNQVVKGTILKVNPFGLFVKLDDEIHGLAHISHLGLTPTQKIFDVYKAGEEVDLAILSIESKEHRLGLGVPKKEVAETEAGEDATEKPKKAKAKKTAEADEIAEEVKEGEEETKVKKEKKTKTVKADKE